MPDQTMMIALVWSTEFLLLALQSLQQISKSQSLLQLGFSLDFGEISNWVRRAIHGSREPRFGLGNGPNKASTKTCITFAYGLELGPFQSPKVQKGQEHLPKLRNHLLNHFNILFYFIRYNSFPSYSHKQLVNTSEQF